MSTANLKKSAQEFLSGQLKGVDVIGIEQELRKLWLSAVSTPQEGQQSSVLRACSLNLILYCQDSDAETTVGNLLDNIAVNNPCRALLAISRPIGLPHIEAWVSARCHLGEGSKQICCEQITILSEAQGPEELASAVLPLLVADLPGFLWWRATSLTPSQLKPYLPALDRLIIDSQLSGDSKDFFATMNPLLRSSERQVFISDLNWRRLYAWRKFIAQLFENTPFQLADLEQIESIEIEYAAPPTAQNNLQAAAANEFNSTSAQSWLLIGWLANRLSWINKKGLNFTSNGKQISAKLSANTSSSLPAGNVLTVTINLEKARKVVVAFDWQRQFNSALPPNLLSTISSNGGEPAKLTSLSPNLMESYLVGQELKSLNADPVFEQALLMVAQIVDNK